MDNQGRTSMKKPASLGAGAALVYFQLLFPGVPMAFIGLTAAVMASGGEWFGVRLLPLTLMACWVVYCAIGYGTRAYRGSDQARWAAVGFLVILPGVADVALLGVSPDVVPLSVVTCGAAVWLLLSSKSAAYCAGSWRPPVVALGSVLRIAGVAVIATGLLEGGAEQSVGHADRGIVIAGVIAGGVMLALARPVAGGNRLAMGVVVFAVVGFALTAAIAAVGTRAVMPAWSVGTLAAIAVIGILAQYLRTHPKQQRPG